jgi:hypothetical protein
MNFFSKLVFLDKFTISIFTIFKLLFLFKVMVDLKEYYNSLTKNSLRKIHEL